MLKLLIILIALASIQPEIFGISDNNSDSNHTVPDDIGITRGDSFAVMSQELEASAKERSTQSKKFYIMTYKKVNWFTALRLCTAYGLNLASLDSKADTDELLQQLANEDFDEAHDGFWTSGNNLSSEESWFWWTGGKPFTYTNWDIWEPNEPSYALKCLEVYRNGFWNDLPCKEKRFFICES